ncbi:ABC transporter permease [Parabacteroides sp. AM08-6]|uniref:ABC transporter permease n=1 Tax=Parabacteroides sp. AM08-6 TaxID=2292053 RepID=UPI000EFF6047|nr:ABC transporter permease [Parabacteroides sp. AM08-6]RHJ81814.1 ABC transporter permease [Parabacteroides sp. AM08-6]
MYKQYFKQAWNLIRQEKLFSIIYIIGTGLSVSMVMVLSIVFYMKVANIYPETNRDRMLIAKSGIVRSGDSTTSSSLSEYVIKTCFGSLKGMEVLGIMESYPTDAEVQPEGSPEQIPVTARFVNTDFWRVFHFRFLSGQAFTVADYQSGLRTAVIAGSLARRLFGTVDAVGRYVMMDFVPYRVCGVVQEASLVTPDTYALLYIPYTARDDYAPDKKNDSTGSLGGFRAYILAAPGTNLDVLKEEAENNVRRYSQTLEEGVEFSILGQPDKQWQTIFRYWSNDVPEYGKLLLTYSLILLILLLVPAVSLSGMADSRMERRLAEMGIRRAFGAPVGVLMRQVISENFLFTLLGGLFGLLFSYLLLYVTRSWVLQIGASFIDILPEGTDVVFTPSMLMNWQVFCIALVVCFLLNLLSSLIPAWRAAHRHIIYSLNAK